MISLTDPILVWSSLFGLLLLAFFLFLYFKKKKQPSSFLIPLDKPRQGFIAPLKKLFQGSRREVKELIPELEETLIQADVGVSTTASLIASLQSDPSIHTSDEAYLWIKKKIQEILTPLHPFKLPAYRPLVFCFVGVNGTGKTTSIGKIAYWLKNQGLKTLLVAGDTFRAAAVDQLKIWAERSEADFVAGGPNADPASVVYDGIQAALARAIDIVLIDTSGRLQTKVPLMEELKKLNRSIEKSLGRGADEIFLVLDATIGQNGLSQAQHFKETIPLTGLILTKYDGTAKGGILVAIIRETGIPLRFLGVGEGIEDLRSFNPPEFITALFKD